MTYRDKSVTVDADSEYIFKSVLGDIVIDQSGIHRKERKRPEEWEKIEATMDRQEVLDGFLPWDDVVEISTKEEFLSYPHIDIYVEDENSSDGKHRLMVFFKKHDVENYDRVDACFKTIRKMWNAYRHRNKLHTLNYSYQDNEHRLTPEEPGQGADSGERKDQEDTAGESDQGQDDEEGDDDEDAASKVGDILDAAINKPDEIMDKFGS